MDKLVQVFVIFEAIQINMCDFASTNGVLNIQSSPTMMNSFLEVMRKYSNTDMVYIITRKKQSNLLSLLHLVKLKEGGIPHWFKLINNISVTEIVKDCENEKKKPILIVLFDDALDLTTKILQRITNVKTLETLTFLAMKANESKDLGFKTISPAARVVTARNKLFSTKNHTDQINVDFMYYNYEFSRVRTMRIGEYRHGKEFVPNFPFRECCYFLKGYPIAVEVYMMKNIYASIETFEDDCKLSGILGVVFTVIREKLGLRCKTFLLYKANMNHTKLLENVTDPIIMVRPYGEYKKVMEKYDTTVGIIYDYMNAVYNPVDFKTKVWTFYTDPFNVYLWIFVFSSFIVILIFPLLARKFERSSVDGLGLLDFFGLQVGQGCSFSYRLVSTRVVLLSVAVFGFLLQVFYSSKVISKNSFENDFDHMNSFFDLAYHEFYFPQILRGSFQLSLIEESPTPTLQALNQRIKREYDRTTYTLPCYECFKLSQCCGGTTISTAIYLANELQQPELKTFRMLTHDETFLKKAIVMALPKNSPLTKIFNNKIMDMKETGVLSKIISLYLKDYNARSPKISARRGFFNSLSKDGPTHTNTITMNLMILPFIIISIGFVLSFIAILIENCLYRYHNKRKDQGENSHID